MTSVASHWNSSRQRGAPALAAALSRKPARLLRDFEFRGDENVLEIGSRCGAVTRLLGERCGRIVAWERDSGRAAIVAARTRDLPNVAVTEPAAHERFDLAVLPEVTAASAPDAIAAASARLRPDGALLAALDMSAVEPTQRGARLSEIIQPLAKPQLFAVYPDHRFPMCVLAHRFFERADLRELVGACGGQIPIGAGSPELPVQAPSLLVLAGAGACPRFPCLGVMYGKGRPAAPELESHTRFIERRGQVRSVKRSLSGRQRVTVGPLAFRGCDDPWITGASLQASLLARAQDPRLSLAEIFRPAVAWRMRIETEADRFSGIGLLPGHFLDATWQNTYMQGDECRFIDLDWEWHRALPLAVVVIRSINNFLQEAEQLRDLNPALKEASRLRLIAGIGRALGVRLTRADFRDWIDIDTGFYSIVEGGSPDRARFYCATATCGIWWAPSVACSAGVGGDRGRCREHPIRGGLS